MRYLIIEDELLAVNRLKKLISTIRPDYQFVSKFDSVEGAVIGLPVLQYDLVLMDIQLADGNSFDIFDQIDLKTPIIFTTAYDTYALKAFKTNSIDYLLKPIDESELKKAIKKFEENHQKKTIDGTDNSITDLIKALNPKGKERFIVKIGEHLKAIETSDIQLVFSHDKGTYLFNKEGRKYLIDYTLDKTDQLLDESQFFKVSRKFIVNISYIKDMIAFTNSRLEIIIEHFDDEQIIVARERVNDFRLWLDR